MRSRRYNLKKNKLDSYWHNFGLTTTRNPSVFCQSSDKIDFTGKTAKKSKSFYCAFFQSFIDFISINEIIN